MLTVDIERLPSFNRGLKKGIQEGLKEGIDKGIEKVAIGMLALNVDIEIIQKTTGLSLEEIEKLRSKI
jgi:predicted transposase/invertase (TIGR01784 family)